MTFSFSLLILFYSIFSFQVHMRRLNQEIEERAVNVAKNLAENGNYWLSIEDLDVLNSLIAQSLSQEVKQIQYWKGERLIIEQGKVGKEIPTSQFTGKPKIQRYPDYLEVLYPVVFGVKKSPAEQETGEIIGNVRLIFSLEKMQSARKQEIRTLCLLGSVGFLLGIFLALLLYFFIVYPVRMLTQAVVAFRSGKSQRLPVRSRDEIGILLSEFNRMTEEIMKSREELEKTLNQLARANQVKSEFLANISHELKTPLHSIMGFTQLLLEKGEGPLTREQEEDLEVILQSSQYLHHLISQVLDFSRIEAGKEEFHFQDFSLRNLLRESYETFRMQAEKKGLHLRLAEGSDPLMVNADKVKLRQVISNLVSNAIKYTMEGEIIIGAEKENGDVVLWVRDTGSGIPEQEREKIFEPFYQIPREETEGVATKGSGLGLAIAKKYVEQMRGKIWVNPAHPRGSIFFVKLPSGGEGNAQNPGGG
ncbi:MAG: HAMP domain-containing sensor histidine kinase [bacterium JZ-2024 1]